MLQHLKIRIALPLLLLFGFIIRVAFINWDNGFHLHPDERMLMIVADRIQFFDKLDPHFFNYGSLPVYILRAVGQIYDMFFSSHISNYDGLLFLGRILSCLFDTGTALFVFLIAQKIFKKEKIALFSLFLYSISFFAIQNSHFFVVDVFLTFFLSGMVYFLLSYVQKPAWKELLLIGICVGCAFATKFTSVIFIPFILGVIFLRTYTHVPKALVSIAVCLLAILITSFIGMPYAFIDYQSFINDIMAQTTMGRDAYIFPYTLQYVGSLPYLYFLKNIFLWGVGPFIGSSALLGIFLSVKELKPHMSHIFRKKSIFMMLVFFLIYFYYFILLGGSAVKFMRYMLPMYPFIAVMAGYGIYTLMNKGKVYMYFASFLFTLSFLWTCLFISLYSVPHTRIQATDWIQKNIPPGSKILTEHWDDRLPLFGAENYFITDLELYNLPDDTYKWEVMNNLLNQSDYIIIASNRLYIPLQRLKDCKKYKKCYPLTAEYYKNLFSGKMSYKKVAEFKAYPGLYFGPIHMYIPDDSADESFTVYDHPKIMIFKKT